MAASGLAINSVTDVTTGEVNNRLTPGGGANLEGSKIKLVGSEAGVGIKLTNQDTQEETVVPMTSVLVNSPSAISFIIPAGLPIGEYSLSIGTQFSNAGTLLKEVRTYQFDYLLKVIP
ncbi:DUF4469 domain-containing protein [Marinilabiliaceae bacterium JC017]|nr:DUF4469 domain-containing protein [Marinilabiliaceae bacterium JC017]